jgi:hypothetical protein
LISSTIEKFSSEFRFTVLVRGSKMENSANQELAMLLQLNDKVRQCHQRSKSCTREPMTRSDPLQQQSWLDAAQAWLRLAKRLAHLPQRTERKDHHG